MKANFAFEMSFEKYVVHGRIHECDEDASLLRPMLYMDVFMNASLLRPVVECHHTTVLHSPIQRSLLVTP